MVVHLEKRHKNHLRFYRVVVVQNMIVDLGHYQHCKCECPDQVHNKIKRIRQPRYLRRGNNRKGLFIYTLNKMSTIVY